MAGESTAAPVPPMRLEPLTFVGYDRGGGGGGGVAGFVHVVTPQGTLIRLRPAPPSYAPAQEAAQQQQPAIPAPPAAAGTTTHPPPPPSTSSARDAAPATLNEPSPPLSALAMAAPPEGFDVEFISSASSASASSTSARTSAAASRSPSRSPAASPADGLPVADHNSNGNGNGNGRTAETGEEPAELRRVLTQEHLTTHKEARQEQRSFPPPPASLPPYMVHGASLSAAAASRTELDAALTQCALALFGGRLPQPQPPAADASDASSASWSEAANYHAATLLGFDEAGCAYIAAQSFAQPVAPPQDWRLCPLPLLVCTSAASLLHFFAEATKDGAGGVRVPVLPKSVAATGATSAGGSPEASRMPPPPPPPPAMAAGAGPGAACFLSPPLRWDLPACGSAPALDLRRVFDVAPGRPYVLARHGEAVVVVGVALDVPWVRAVVPLPSAGRGTPPVPPPSGGAAVSPPAGYRWKDPRGWAEPLAGCHTALDLRARHGLDDAAGAQANANAAATESEEGEQEAEAEAAQEKCSTPQAPPLHPASPPLPPAAALAEEAQAPSSATPASSVAASATTAPAFVKEGDVVFVPGRFGVLLECNAQPALLERQCGLAHGDRVEARRAGVLSAASSLRSGRSTATTPPLSSGPEWTVMGLHGRNVLVLLGAPGGRGEGQPAAAEVPITGGVAEVAELFRKVAGAALPPPALPLEPRLPASSSASPAEGRSVADAALPPLAQAAVPGHATDVSTEDAAAPAPAPAAAAASAATTAGVAPEATEEAGNAAAEPAAHGSCLPEEGPQSSVPALADAKEVPGIAASVMEYEQQDVSPLTPSAPPSTTRAAAVAAGRASAGAVAGASEDPLGAATAVRAPSTSVSTSSSASATPAALALSRQARVQLEEEEQPQPQQNGDARERSGGDLPPPTRSTAPSTPRGSAASSPPLASPPPPTVLVPSAAQRSSSASGPDTVLETPAPPMPATPPPPHQVKEEAEELAAAVVDDSEALAGDMVPAVTPVIEVPPAADDVHEAPDLEAAAAASQDDDDTAAAVVAATAAAMAASVVLVESESSESVAGVLADGLGLHAGADVVEAVHREGNQSEEASLDVVNEVPLGSQAAAAAAGEEEEPRIIVPQLRGDAAARAGLTAPPHARDAVNAASGSAYALSADHTPSVLPTPSASQPRSSLAHPPSHPPPHATLTASDEEVVDFGDHDGEEVSAGTRGREEASPEAAPPALDGVLYAAPPAPQPPLRLLPNPAAPAVHYAPHDAAHGPPNGVAAATAPAPPSHVPHLPVPVMPVFAPPTAAVAHASAFTPSYSPSPTGPADGRTAPRGPPPGHVTSYHASHSPDAAAAAIAPPRFSVATSFTPSTTANARVTPTPFTNFLKAYAIFVLENYVDAAEEPRGGVHGALGVGKHVGSHRGPASSPAVAGLAPLLNFYRERPLLRIAAATECQRRCRAAWEAAGLAVAARTNVQLRKLRSSATSTVFEELCVDELVTVLGMVPHLPPPPL